MSEIEHKIANLTKTLEDCTIFMRASNREIEAEILKPNDLQQGQIDTIADLGRNAIAEIQRLNQLLAFGEDKGV